MLVWGQELVGGFDLAWVGGSAQESAQELGVVSDEESAEESDSVSDDASEEELEQSTNPRSKSDPNIPRLPMPCHPLSLSDSFC